MNEDDIGEEYENKGLISVIIPVYKVERYIKACMRSLISQHYKNFEVILVDDAGGDSSINIAIGELANSGISWRVIYNSSNRGLSYSRNVGVKNARGEFLYFLDSDDYISADALMLLFEEISRTKADMVYGSIVYDIGGQIKPSPWEFINTYSCFISPFHLYITQKTFVMAWNRLISRRFYNQTGLKFIEGIVHEDEPWSFSLILRAKKISFVKQVTYYYRKHNDSITAQVLDAFRLNCFYCHIDNCSKESYRFTLWEDKEFRTWYARTIFSFFHKVFDSNLSAKDKVTFLNKVYAEVRIPETEMNQIAFYSLAKKMAKMLPNYQWLKLLVKVKRLKNVISLKLRNIFNCIYG